MCNTRGHGRTASLGSDKGGAKVKGGWFCVTKGQQAVIHTFLWAGHRRLSSSARWELGHHGPRT